MKSRLELHYSFSIALPLLLSNILNKVSHPIYVKLKNDCKSLYSSIVRYKIIRYKKFMPPDKPLYQ